MAGWTVVPNSDTSAWKPVKGAAAPSPPIDYSHPKGLPAGDTLPGVPAHAPSGMPQERNAQILAQNGNPGTYANTQKFIENNAPTLSGLGKAAQVSLGQAKSDLSPSNILHPLQYIASELNQHATAPDTSTATGPTEPTLGDAAKFGANVGGNLAGLYQGGERPLENVPGKILRAPFTTAVDEPMAGGLTPRQRFGAAKRVGVNLDLADATGSGLPKMLKAINQDSLFGSSVNEAAKTGRVAALNDSGTGLLGELSPLDGEAGGKRLQDLLKSNQKGLLDSSREGYGTIAQRFGDNPVADPTAISSIADRLKSTDAQHLQEFPSLGMGKVGAVIDDAAKYGKAATPPVKMSGLVDEAGSPIASSIQPPSPKSPVVRDAIKARSGILDMYQNNPELVKSAADAHLQQLVSGADNAISGSLGDEGLGIWRDANSKYKEMKGTYDNPSHPYYSAVRTPTPSTLVQGIGKTPEMLRDLVQRTGPEGSGIVQRGVAEKLMQTPSGDSNMGRLPGNLARLPEEYGQQLFGEHLPRLNDLSSASQALAKDLNPSGTAKQTQKLAEAAAFLPTGGAPALQYPIAKFLNSPRIVDWMMKDTSSPATKSGNKIAPAIMPALQPLAVQKKTGTR
jgi:hypothetical protein